MTGMGIASPQPCMSDRQSACLIAAGVVSFHLAYNFTAGTFLIVVYLYGLAALAWQRTSRRAFYFGLSAGLLAYAPQLSCFYVILGRQRSRFGWCWRFGWGFL